MCATVFSMQLPAEPHCSYHWPRPHGATTGGYQGRRVMGTLILSGRCVLGQGSRSVGSILSQLGGSFTSSGPAWMLYIGQWFLIWEVILLGRPGCRRPAL